ncbi:MAG: hypothetical protein D6743_20330, partial [Calditrichaeota bacterium]
MRSETLSSAVFLSLSVLLAYSCRHNVLQSTAESSTLLWKQTSLDSSSITALAAGQNGDIFAANKHSWLFSSSDNGESWTARHTGFENPIIRLALTQNGDIFAATYGGIRGALFRSTDNGQTWVPLPFPGGYFITKIVFGASGRVFVVTPGGGESVRGGMFRSDDDGSTWSEIRVPARFPIDLDLAPNGYLYLATEDAGVFRSADEGGTWVSLNTGLVDRRVTQIAVDNSANIYVSTSHGIFRSSNQGFSWVQTTWVEPCIDILFTDSAGYVFAGHGSYNCGDPVGLYYSVDRGKSWMHLNQGLPNDLVTVATVTPSGDVFAGLSERGLFRT